MDELSLSFRHLPDCFVDYRHVCWLCINNIFRIEATKECECQVEGIEKSRRVPAYTSVVEIRSHDKDDSAFYYAFQA